MNKVFRSAAKAAAVICAGMVASGFAASAATAAPAAAEAAVAPAAVPPVVNAPEEGVLVMATFNQTPYSYWAFKKALPVEIPAMAKLGVKWVASYRVLVGDMDKYVDFWWAPDYKTFKYAFFEAPADPELVKLAPVTMHTLQNAKIEIVSDEKF